MKQERLQKGRLGISLLLFLLVGLFFVLQHLFFSKPEADHALKTAVASSHNQQSESLTVVNQESHDTATTDRVHNSALNQSTVSGQENRNRKPAQAIDKQTDLSRPQPKLSLPKAELPVDKGPSVQEKRTLEDRRFYEPEFWLWAGVGGNYQYYKQSVPSNDGKADFQNIKGPTLYLASGFQGANLGAELVYKETPGKMSAPAGVTIKGGNYVWKTLSTEAFYRPDDSQWRYRLGFQYHTMPFMAYSPSLLNLDIKSNTLVMATLGFDRTFLISKKMRAEWNLRYQHPLLSGTADGSTFKVLPIFAFDGSIGASYKVGENFRAGLFWYGQYHHYRFNFFDTRKLTGEQTLFYSNAEFRLGFEF